MFGYFLSSVTRLAFYDSTQKSLRKKSRRLALLWNENESCFVRQSICIIWRKYVVSSCSCINLPTWREKTLLTFLVFKKNQMILLIILNRKDTSQKKCALVGIFPGSHGSLLWSRIYDVIWNILQKKYGRIFDILHVVFGRTICHNFHGKNLLFNNLCAPLLRTRHTFIGQ